MSGFLYPHPYIPSNLIDLIEHLTNSEFDPLLWCDDPDMDMEARYLRDSELLLDLTGNIDSCA